MLHILKLIVEWSCVILTLGLVSFNGAYMLFAPRMWMTTKKWYFAQGGLRYRRRHLSGEADWELRLTGALILGLIGYCIINSVLY